MLKRHQITWLLGSIYPENILIYPDLPGSMECLKSPPPQKISLFPGNQDFMGFHENSYTWLMGKMGDWDHLVFASSGWCDQLLMSMTLKHSGKVMDFPGLIFWNGEDKPETERRCGPVDFGDVKLLTTLEPLNLWIPWRLSNCRGKSSP